MAGSCSVLALTSTASYVSARLPTSQTKVGQCPLHLPALNALNTSSCLSFSRRHHRSSGGRVGCGAAPAQQLGKWRTWGHVQVPSAAAYSAAYPDDSEAADDSANTSNGTAAAPTAAATVAANATPAVDSEEFARSGFGFLPAQNTKVEEWESWIEQKIFNCRFLTLLAVAGSLSGSTLCFIKGCIFVAAAFQNFFLSCIRNVGSGKVILLLVEALDVFLIGTIMLIFGMGLYELFVDTLDIPPTESATTLFRDYSHSSSLFGLFPLRARPKWLEIHSLEEMKTKLGHVIVMILLVGMFEKSKKVVITTAVDLFMFSASVCAAAACLYLLSKLSEFKGNYVV